MNERIEGRIVAAWRDAVGPQLASYTSPLHLTDGCLFVAVPSPLWAEELGRLRWHIAERLNVELGGGETVEFLEFVAGDG